jgi:hypothetical protein
VFATWNNVTVPKLSEIIDAAAGETVSIPSLLRRLKAVASELGAASLVDWVDIELSGYLDPEVLPPQYRGPFKVVVVAKWAGPGGSSATMPLPSIALPEAMRKAPYELVFRQSVSELQKAAQSDDLLMHAWPADAVAKVNDMISRGQIRPEIPMGTLVHAYRQFSPALITGILDAIQTRVLDVALALQQVAPRAGEAGAPPVDPTRVQLVVENWGQEPGSASAWDVHIGYLPPHRWEELPNTERAREVFGGSRDRPGITVEPIAWESLRMTPRWLGDDSSSAVAAIQPSDYFNRGADEWDRFIAGAQARRELALAISMVGSLDEPKIVWPGGSSASVSLPGAAPGIAHVGGPRIPLAKAPSVAEGLGPADRDLARLINARDPKLPWWSLDLTGVERFYAGGGSEMIDPTGTLSPLLISAAGEVVAAVWTSSDGAVRHYVIPWMPVWMPVLEWLGQRGIPELVLSTAGRAESKAGEEPDVGETGDSVSSTVGPADATAQLTTPDPAESSSSPEPAGAAADVPTRDDRAIGKRRRHDRLKKIGFPLRAAWSGVKKNTPAAITATIAAVAGPLILLYFFHLDSGSHGPETSTPSSPTTLTSPSSSTGTTAPTTTASSTDLPTMSPRPLAPPEEQVIQAGSSGEFFQREVIVGVGMVFPSWSALTITTAKLSCTTTNLNVGQAVSVAGKNGDRDDYFRVTLLQSARDVSSTVRVEELPFPSWPTGTLCPQ